MDPKIAVALLETVQIDLHRPTLPALGPVGDLVLRSPRGMSPDFRHNFRHLPSHLVLRVATDYSNDSSNDHASFNPHLVLHHLPG